MPFVTSKIVKRVEANYKLKRRLNFLSEVWIRISRKDGKKIRAVVVIFIFCVTQKLFVSVKILIFNFFFISLNGFAQSFLFTWFASNVCTALGSRASNSLSVSTHPPNKHFFTQSLSHTALTLSAYKRELHYHISLSRKYTLNHLSLTYYLHTLTVSLSLISETHFFTVSLSLPLSFLQKFFEFVSFSSVLPVWMIEQTT